MKLKKLLAAVTAAALAVSTMAVTGFTASAASLSSAPEGTETVLYSVDLSAVKSEFTSAWDNGDWTQVVIDESDRETIMSDPNVYVKATMSNIGNAATDDGDVDFDTIISWGWSSYNWACVLKWYNNAGDGADFECSFIAIPLSTSSNAIAYAPISDLAIYDWGGIAGNLQCGCFSSLTLNSLEIVRIGAGSASDDPVTPETQIKNIAFPTGAVELTVGNDDVNAADKKAKVDIACTELNGKTFGELKTTTLKATGVGFTSCSVDGVTAADVTMCIYTLWNKDTDYKWTANSFDKTLADGNNSTYDLSTVADVADDYTLAGYGIQLFILNEKLGSVEKGDTVTINGGTPVDPPAGGRTHEGSVDITADNGWGQTQDGAPSLAELIGDLNPTKTTIVFSGASLVKVGYNSVKTTPNAEGSKWFEVEASNGTATVDASDIVVDGYWFSIAVSDTSTVTWIATEQGDEPVTPPAPDDPVHTHTPAAEWSKDQYGHWHACPGCTTSVEFAVHTFNAGTITTPATETTAGTKTFTCDVCGYTKTESIPATGTSTAPTPETPSYGGYTGAPVIPFSGVKTGNAPTVNGKDGWEAVAAEIEAASDGDKLVVDMNGATKVPSTVFKAIKGKDIDLVLNLNSSVKWTINGLSVTSTKIIDFDVTKNTKHIPNEAVDKAEGSHKRQISLDHNGSFGCGAVMTYDVGTQYNGLYANLFYYNRKAKELELVYCSPISGGKANFLFTHASDYLITISDEPLGDYEDVSSAAGITSDSSGISGIAFCSVLAVITLAFGFVVYKKRRHN